MGGRAVRLVQGRFEDATTYHDDPLEAAQSWVDAGARYLHVVDLDGAKEGAPRSIEHLRRIVHGTGVPVQYGGGLRTVEAVRDALRAAPSARSSAPRRSPTSTSSTRSLRRSVRDRRVRRRPRRLHLHRGLDETTEMPAVVAIRRLMDRGVASFVYTNVDRDGQLEGLTSTRSSAFARRRARPLPVLRRDRPPRGSADPRRLRQVNLSGVIVGKALYEKRFTIAEGQAALDGAD